MTTSAIPAAIDWLVGACQAGIVPVGGSTVPVFVNDGPWVTQDVLAYPQRLMIGGDVINPGEPAAEGEQMFAALNRARTRDEVFHIVCSAEDWSGDTAMKPRRDNAYALVAQVELLLRGVPPTGPGDATMGGTVLYAGISGPMQYHEGQQVTGAAATVVFRIAAKARLTT